MEPIVPILSIVCALIGYSIGKPKGRSVDGILLGLFLGPIGVLIIAVLRPLGKKCPYCGGILNKGATVCCHCGRDTVVIKRRVAKVTCPMCGAAIVRSTLHKGQNICPYCAEPFEIE